MDHAPIKTWCRCRSGYDPNNDYAAAHLTIDEAGTLRRSEDLQRQLQEVVEDKCTFYRMDLDSMWAERDMERLWNCLNTIVQQATNEIRPQLRRRWCSREHRELEQAEDDLKDWKEHGDLIRQTVAARETMHINVATVDASSSATSFASLRYTLRQENERIQQKDSVLFVERDRLSTWSMRLDSQAKVLEVRRRTIQEREERLQVQEDNYTARKESLGDLTQSLELARISADEEKKKSEELRKKVEVMDEASKDNALRGLKLFVRMWKNEILTMIQQDKLRCIIPWDTSTWFRANYYKLDSAREEDLTHWMSDYLDVTIRDLCIDINTELPRFVIFYRKSKLEKHATESWDGNTQNALKNMHTIQEDDWEKVDEKLEAGDRRP
jgi:hypothetical protein